MEASHPSPSPVRVPGYAWAWLQRSRPVLVELAQRLTGAPPSPGFVEDLRATFERDPFVRGILADVVAEVAFRGRVPRRRPPGAHWDRGLTWWAATLAGVSLTEFDHPRTAGAQRSAQPALFAGPHEQQPAGPVPGERRPPLLPVSSERAAFAEALRSLLDQAEAGVIPVAGVRQLLASLEHESRPPAD